MIHRLHLDNKIARDRVIENRTMISKYEHSIIKWMNICRESEITGNDINLRSVTLNNSINVEK